MRGDLTKPEDFDYVPTKSDITKLKQEMDDAAD